MDFSPRLNQILYHLGKGIWKGVPVIGPIVEEVLFEANKDLLLHEVEEKCSLLSHEDLKALDVALREIETASDTAAKQVQSQLVEIEDQIDTVAAHIHEDLSTILSVVTSLKEDRDKAQNEEARKAIQTQIDAMEMRRKTWISGISHTQSNLLAYVPTSRNSAEPRRTIFLSAKGNIQKLSDARYEEMNFRMHELRWLGLVIREKRQISNTRNTDWFYWRTRDGTELVDQQKTNKSMSLKV